METKEVIKKANDLIEKLIEKLQKMEDEDLIEKLQNIKKKKRNMVIENEKVRK